MLETMGRRDGSSACWNRSYIFLECVQGESQDYKPSRVMQGLCESQLLSLKAFLSIQKRSQHDGGAVRTRAPELSSRSPDLPDLPPH
ncbi:Echinoderm Microtubule-Associated Protein-Like 5 [Manis pentadactyla]|nr:Echinoderm Microtubule-Associated Protein-Like 5 [Manis pentadactyla]